jgi:hypothetical protein
MSQNTMIEKAGSVADEIIQLRADALCKQDPSLTPEQAYAAVYTAPESLHLRRAEREANGFVKYVDESDPAPMQDPVRKQSSAYSELEGIAKGLRETYPVKTDAQCFEMATKIRPEFKAERDASRALIGA